MFGSLAVYIYTGENCQAEKILMLAKKIESVILAW